MAIGRSNVIAPKEIVLPTTPVASQKTTAQIGSLAVSGAKLVFFDGTTWKTVTSA